MTNLNDTPPSELSDDAIIGLTQHVHMIMDKHVLVLERAEQTTSTLVNQLLKAQADNNALTVKLREADQLSAKLRESEEARDKALERCKKAVDELVSTKLEFREFMVEHNSCHAPAASGTIQIGNKSVVENIPGPLVK
ncbi:hypothetical protein HYPSUDRAFT_58080 [Hypholoma sublateritium FD-334 SS-4]|uniref:Uncharacterized protein n=1 Tax=Hypholoma sublateritium (strain FD-334 SS-4) TaxID=945553 RepID=A0A0D2KQ52_HYPSF|nr:hypothetical protein HYPSUDRAFT_58080 [Hypholoma sublateritium FD-334 SS-4]